MPGWYIARRVLYFNLKTAYAGHGAQREPAPDVLGGAYDPAYGLLSRCHRCRRRGHLEAGPAVPSQINQWVGGGCQETNESKAEVAPRWRQWGWRAVNAGVDRWGHCRDGTGASNAGNAGNGCKNAEPTAQQSRALSSKSLESDSYSSPCRALIGLLAWMSNADDDELSLPV